MQHFIFSFLNTLISLLKFPWTFKWKGSLLNAFITFKCFSAFFPKWKLYQKYQTCWWVLAVNYPKICCTRVGVTTNKIETDLKFTATFSCLVRELCVGTSLLTHTRYVVFERVCMCVRDDCLYAEYPGIIELYPIMSSKKRPTRMLTKHSGCIDDNYFLNSICLIIFKLIKFMFHLILYLFIVINDSIFLKPMMKNRIELFF